MCVCDQPISGWGSQLLELGGGGGEDDDDDEDSSLLSFFLLLLLIGKQHLLQHNLFIDRGKVFWEMAPDTTF